MQQEQSDLTERIKKLEAALELSEWRLKRLERLVGTSPAEEVLIEATTPPLPAEEALIGEVPATVTQLPHLGVEPVPAPEPVPEAAVSQPARPAVEYGVDFATGRITSRPARPALQFPQLSSELEAAIGTSWLNRLGIVAIVAAVAYFLKYAFDNDWIGPAGRVAITLLVGAILLALGERFQRQKLQLFAQGLSGGGIAVLYFGVYAAFATYRLIGLAPAFGTMILVTTAATLLALRYDSPAIAVLGLFGGFATPLALGGDTTDVTGATRTGAPVSVSAGLYLYFLLLDAGAYVIARHKSWWWFGGAALAAGFLVPVFLASSATPHGPAAAVYFALATLATLVLAVTRGETALAWAALAGGFFLAPMAGAGVFTDLANKSPIAALVYYAVVTLVALAVADRQNWRSVAIVATATGIVSATFVFYRPTLVVPGFIFLIGLTVASLYVGARRRWPGLELTVLVITALCATGIIESRYIPFAPSPPDLVGVTLLFVLFTGAAAMASSEHTEKRSLLAVLATAAYGGQLYLILGPGNPDFLALAAVAIAAYHVIVSRVVMRRAYPLLAVLVFLGLAATGLTIAIPLKLRQEAVPLAWTVEAVALAWAARRTGNAWAARAAAVVGTLMVLRLLLVEESAILHAGLVLTSPGLAFVAGIAGLVVAARLVQGAHLMREDGYLAPGLGVTAAALLFLWGIFEINGAYVRAAAAAGGLTSARQATLSAWSALYGLGLIVAGFIRAIPAVRWAGIGLLGVTIAKVLVLDLAEVSVAYRIMSLGVLGILLLLASLIYNRYQARLKQPPVQAGGHP